jgi:trimethylamine--corrinoid protein Co-methyltransferase
MQSGGFSGGQYRPLSEDQVKKIHEASLSILEKIGFTYEKGLESTLEMLEGAGAAVDREQSRITFPRELVMEQAARAPERVILYSRATAITILSLIRTGYTWAPGGRQ